MVEHHQPRFKVTEMRRVIIALVLLAIATPAIAGVVNIGPPPPYVIAFNGQSGDVMVNAFDGATCNGCFMAGPTTMTSTATLNGSSLATSSSVAAAVAAIAFPVTSVNAGTGAITGIETTSHASATYSTPSSVATAIAAITPYTAGSGISVNAGTRVISATPTAYAVSYPTSRSLSLATAYQCTDNTKPCVVTINLTSTANFSLTGGTTNSADVVIGPTNAVAGGTGTVIGKYSNSVTGTIAIGLNMNSAAATPITVTIPAGGYLAIRQTAGTVAITSAYDQSTG